MPESYEEKLKQKELSLFYTAQEAEDNPQFSQKGTGQEAQGQGFKGDAPPFRQLTPDEVIRRVDGLERLGEESQNEFVVRHWK